MESRDAGGFWGDGSVEKVFAEQACGPEFRSQHLCRSQTEHHMSVKLAVGLETGRSQVHAGSVVWQKQ